MKARERALTLLPEHTCTACRGRVGAAAFALLPDGTVAHYNCHLQGLQRRKAALEAEQRDADADGLGELWGEGQRSPSGQRQQGAGGERVTHRERDAAQLGGQGGAGARPNGAAGGGGQRAAGAAGPSMQQRGLQGGDGGGASPSPPQQQQRQQPQPQQSQQQRAAAGAGALAGSGSGPAPFDDGLPRPGDRGLAGRIAPLPPLPSPGSVPGASGRGGGARSGGRGAGEEYYDDYTDNDDGGGGAPPPAVVASATPKSAGTTLMERMGGLFWGVPGPASGGR